MQQLGKAICKFLWKGGKRKTNKLHLLRWNTIWDLMESRGFKIKHPQSMNLEIGVNILWRLISCGKSWWKLIIHKKNRWAN